MNDSDRKSVLIGCFMILFGCGIGICNSFWPTLASGFDRMQADPIDTRFNQYILEHTFHCVTQGNYAGTLWSPPFFFPTRNVLAYSDNLLGAAPLYWLLRFVFNLDVAYSLWMIGCGILCFLAFTAVSCRLKLHPALIAAGSMLFAFGLHRSRLINHQQLLPQFFTPLAIWAAWESVRRPRLLSLAAFGACIFLQLLCGIYLGFFLIVSLFPFIAILLLTQPKALRSIMLFARRQWLAILLLSIALMSLCLLTFHPYLSVHHSVGGYAWADVRPFLPTPRSWLPPWKIADMTSQGAADFSITVKPALPMAGFIFTIAATIALIHLIRSAIHRENESAPIGIAAFGAAIILILLATRWPGDLSPWRILYDFLPGAHAIRAVSRIDLLVFFYLTLAIMIGLDLFLKKIPPLRNRTTLACLIAILLISEQCVTSLPSFDAPFYRNQTIELSTLTAHGGDAAYVADYFPPSQFDYTAMQISAMQAGLSANKPIINGYSGWFPANFTGQLRPILPAKLTPWLAAAPDIKTVTIIAPQPPGLPSDWAEHFPATQQQSSQHFDAITLKIH